MSDVVTTILAGAATVAVLAIREAISWGVSRGQAPPLSTTILPPPPQPSQPTGPAVELAALQVRVKALEDARERDIEKASEKAATKAVTRALTSFADALEKKGKSDGEQRPSEG